MSYVANLSQIISNHGLGKSKIKLNISGLLKFKTQLLAFTLCVSHDTLNPLLFIIKTETGDHD